MESPFFDLSLTSTGKFIHGTTAGTTTTARAASGAVNTAGATTGAATGTTAGAATGTAAVAAAGAAAGATGRNFMVSGTRGRTLSIRSTMVFRCYGSTGRNTATGTYHFC